MLKEPGAHDVGGVFGQDPPLILGLLVFAVQQGRQVQVYLHIEHRRGSEGKEEKKRRKKKRMVGLTYCCHGNKGRLPITFFSSFFFQWQGQKHLL